MKQSKDHQRQHQLDREPVARSRQDVTEIKPGLAGTQPRVSIDKTRRLIGFEPEYTVGEGNHHAE